MPVVPRREFDGHGHPAQAASSHGDHDRISIKFLREPLEVSVLLLCLRAERILPGAQSISESLSHNDGWLAFCIVVLLCGGRRVGGAVSSCRLQPRDVAAIGQIPTAASSNC